LAQDREGNIINKYTNVTTPCTLPAS